MAPKAAAPSKAMQDRDARAAQRVAQRAQREAAASAASQAAQDAVDAKAAKDATDAQALQDAEVERLRNEANTTISPISSHTPTASVHEHSTGRTPSSSTISSGYIPNTPRGSTPGHSTGRPPSSSSISSGYNPIPNTPRGSPRSRPPSTPASTGRTPGHSLSSTDSPLSSLRSSRSAFSPPGSPNRRSPSPVPSTGRTPPSQHSSSESQASAHSSWDSYWDSSRTPSPPRRPSPPRIPTPPDRTPSPFPSPTPPRDFPRPPSPPSSSEDSQDLIQGNPSDTPPLQIIGDGLFRPAPRIDDGFSTSRQMYVHLRLLRLREESANFFTAFFRLLYYRLAYYPWEMYTRQVLMVFCVLGTSMMTLNHFWDIFGLRAMPENERPARGKALCEVYVFAVWLYLHCFDMYRGIEYLIRTPWGTFSPGEESVIRPCALLRPLARLVVAGSVLLVLVGDVKKMTFMEWRVALGRMASSTFTLGVVCGCVEAMMCWFLGFFIWRRIGAYNTPYAGQFLALVRPWREEQVMFAGTVVAVFYAYWYVWVVIVEGVGNGDRTGYHMVGGEGWSGN